MNGRIRMKKAASKAKKIPGKRAPAGGKRPKSSKMRADSDSGDRKNGPPRVTAVVGIGASAGGFEAFSELLQHLGSSTGMTYVFVQHLDPTRKSQLVELLSRCTEMPVSELHGVTRLQPNQVYITPPDNHLRSEEH